MMKLLVVLAAVCGVLSAVTDTEWKVYKAKHEKIYGKQEDLTRRGIFEDNLRLIRTHNEKYARGESTYYLGVNQFADMTNFEFRKTMNGISIKKSYGLVDSAPNASLPTTVDWVKKGYVTGVKNQGQCGGCWAFSTTGSLEGQHFKATGNLVSLSESNLLDCSTSYGNLGCNGGLMDNAFRYIIANKGIDTEASYPYVPKNERCTFKRDDVGATMTSYKNVAAGSESALQEAVATVGPVSVGIDASHESFQSYAGGVYNEPQCSSSELDHGVLAVGYGTYGGSAYWLVKNSWGPSWGLNGYIMMSRNRNNQCGIATAASYPIV